jgi:uncharacterized protein YdaU (DUF1376 family)
MDYWQNGKLPNEDRQLARIAKMTDKEWKKAKPILAQFFRPDWTHHRVEEELDRANKLSETRREIANGMHRNKRMNGHAKDHH